MAGSRREKLGSILSRLTGLMQSGALSSEERPIWYDIVKTLPPKPSPPQKEVPIIFYPEDFVRVHFYEKFVQTDPVMLTTHMKTIPQRFIDKYIELHRSNAVPTSDLFQQTVSALKSEGFHLTTHQEKAAATAIKSSFKQEPGSSSEKVEQKLKTVNLNTLFDQ
ncbi:28S ribosomal protein S23 mitochondrial [Biomphalaria pfeifferi]|uniref:Small ribosomal subunit protein mS23 n=1 Tax=Biomphalaria pfeifferi TaxID=112525 RepID=A0AAD8FLK8_BIOPF|nr:28S ribosomal protein S23 mitochondrial [Biomphalaria pfeifferi]